MEISHIIEDLELLASTRNRVPGFRKKVLIDVERLVNIADELRSSVPANVQEAREIITQKESMLNQAYLEAQRIRESAEHDAQEITSKARDEHASRVEDTEIIKAAEQQAREVNDEALRQSQQITQDAQQRAYSIMEESESEATRRRAGADQYAREVLFNMEEQLADVLTQVRRGIDALGMENRPQVPA